jgi:hypothetical protein
MATKTNKMTDEQAAKYLYNLLLGAIPENELSS